MKIKTSKRQAFEAGLDPKTLEPYTYSNGQTLSVPAFLSYENWTGLSTARLYEAGRLIESNIREWICELYPAPTVDDMLVQDRFILAVQFQLDQLSD